MYDAGVNDDPTYASIGSSALGSELIQVLCSPAIVPGTQPGYDTCKQIYAFHPLGAVLAEAPIKRAQGQDRILSLDGVLAEGRLIKQFVETWDTIGKVGATQIIRNLATLARVYGIASIGVGELNTDTSAPIDLADANAADLYFNVFDPLNTAGSLVLSQDPNSPLYLKQGTIRVQGKEWHPSRTIAKLNEDPLYIEWSASAFGFVGRSVYQRALYPLKTFLQSMVTDQMVTQKAGLLVYKMKSPGSFIDNVMQAMGGWKRSQIKAGTTNQVLSIGLEEDVEALKLEHLEPAARFARENCIKNIATAAGMPASIIAQETLTEGFGEGSEDAKKEAAYLDDVRRELKPSYAFMDRIVQRIAWTPEFYRSLFGDYPEYEKMPYDTAMHLWMSAFSATWPNILEEPESEKAKAADVRFKTVIALLETMAPELDPGNKAKLFEWAAANLNELEELFASQLDLDIETLLAYFEENAARAREMAEAATAEPEKEPGEPASFGARS